MHDKKPVILWLRIKTIDTKVKNKYHNLQENEQKWNIISLKAKGDKAIQINSVP